MHNMAANQSKRDDKMARRVAFLWGSVAPGAWELGTEARTWNQNTRSRALGMEEYLSIFRME